MVHATEEPATAAKSTKPAMFTIESLLLFSRYIRPWSAARALTFLPARAAKAWRS